MKPCPYCGAQIEENARFCLYCMTSLETKTKVKTNIKLKKRWPYIIAAVLVLTIVALSVFFPLIKNKSPNTTVEISHETEPIIENNSSTITSSTPSSSIISTSSESVTSQQSTSDSKETKSNNSSKNNSSKSSSSNYTSKKINSSQNSTSLMNSTSPKPSISDYLYFRERKVGGGYIIDGYKEGINKRVILPDTYKGLPVQVIAAMCFVDCNISYVYIPPNVEYIEDNAFYRCTLSEVQFSNGLKRILCGAFVECVNLKAVTLPDSLLILESFAFQSCKNLTSVSIGKNTTEIWQDCFSDCSKLEHVYYRGTESDREKLIISSGNEQLLSATWHYVN